MAPNGQAKSTTHKNEADLFEQMLQLLLKPHKQAYRKKTIANSPPTVLLSLSIISTYLNYTYFI